MISLRPRYALGKIAAFIVVGLCLSLSAPPSVPQALGTQDREINGFNGIAWGEHLDRISGLRLIESGTRIQTYEMQAGPPPLGEAKADLVKFVAVDGEFARAAIHYSGEQNHAHMLSYLESQFGPIERAPGSMIRGLTQQFTWRTEETDVNLTYRSYQQRGTVFIESRTLAPRFNDGLTDSGF